jgi:hypothetical protein
MGVLSYVTCDNDMEDTQQLTLLALLDERVADAVLSPGEGVAEWTVEHGYEVQARQNLLCTCNGLRTDVHVQRAARPRSFRTTPRARLVASPRRSGGSKLNVGRVRCCRRVPGRDERLAPNRQIAIGQRKPSGSLSKLTQARQYVAECIACCTVGLARFATCKFMAQSRLVV